MRLLRRGGPTTRDPTALKWAVGSRLGSARGTPHMCNCECERETSCPFLSRDIVCGPKLGLRWTWGKKVRYQQEMNIGCELDGVDGHFVLVAFPGCRAPTWHGDSRHSAGRTFFPTLGQDPSRHTERCSTTKSPPPLDQLAPAVDPPHLPLNPKPPLANDSILRRASRRE